MQKLKEAYIIKKHLSISNISELGDILKNHSNLNTIDINPDNTIYVESDCGMDSIKNSVDEGMVEWVKRNVKCPINMIYNTLPISSNSCIVKI